MRNLIKLLSAGFLIFAVSSCGMMTGDKFVYLGHGEDTPDYQLYYDKTQKLFVFIDKRNGCFQKDDTGTCLALTLKQAREFREKVLSKMIDIDLRLAKDAYGDYAINELESAGVTTVNKPIKITDVFATPIRQIVIDRKQQYHLVRNDYKIDANLVAMVTKGHDGKKKIKVAYTIDFPGIAKKYNTQLRPFVIDPEYMYTHMTMDAVHEAQFMQKDVLKNQKEVTKQVDDYLKNVVDEGDKQTKHPEVAIAQKVSKLEGDLVTDNRLLEDSGSSVEIADNDATTDSTTETNLDTTKSSSADNIAAEDAVATTPQNAAVESTNPDAVSTKQATAAPATEISKNTNN